MELVFFFGGGQKKFNEKSGFKIASLNQQNQVQRDAKRRAHGHLQESWVSVSLQKKKFKKKN